MNKILIIEDEIKIAELMRDYLIVNQHEVQIIADGAEADAALLSFAPDLVLLDLMLPNKNGIEICQAIRTRTDALANIGIIMVTAKVEEVDRLIGLELGADDYICKPFSPKEVVARAEALLRRLKPSTSVYEALIEINEECFTASVKGQLLDLTPTEFRLLASLINKPGHIYSRAKLIDSLHEDFRDISDRAVDSHIKNLRKKLKEALPEQEIIKSVYGVGYKAEL